MKIIKPLLIIILLSICLAAEMTDRFMGSAESRSSTIYCTKYTEDGISVIGIKVASDDSRVKSGIILSIPEMRQVIKAMWSARRWLQAHPGGDRSDESFLHLESDNSAVVVSVITGDIVLTVAEGKLYRLHIIRSERIWNDTMRLLSYASGTSY